MAAAPTRITRAGSITKAQSVTIANNTGGQISNATGTASVPGWSLVNGATGTIGLIDNNGAMDSGQGIMNSGTINSIDNTGTMDASLTVLLCRFTF